MAELTINTGDITAALQKNLSGYNPSLESTQVGRVLEVGDGIARVSGLPDVGVNELLEFEGFCEVVAKKEKDCQESYSPACPRLSSGTKNKCKE